MNRTVLFFLLWLLFSCSILEDSDITSRDQLLKLKLTSIQITQSLNGVSTTKSATVTQESINESSPQGKLVKRVTISWPSFENPHLLFRSGVTSNITIIMESGEDGKIKFCKVKSSGTIAETYMFSHRPDGTVNTLHSSITKNDVLKTDIDYYSDDKENFPYSRNLYAADVSIKNSWGGPAQSLNPCGFSSTWQYNWDCPTNPSICSWQNEKEYFYCGHDNFYIIEDGTQVGRLLFGAIDSELLEEVHIEETRTNNVCCTDQFFFHPYLFMSVDHRIRVMYAPDWWNEDDTFSGDTKKSIGLKFKYEK